MFIVHSCLILMSYLNYSLVVLGCVFPLLPRVVARPVPSDVVVLSQGMIVGFLRYGLDEDWSGVVRLKGGGEVWKNLTPLNFGSLGFIEMVVVGFGVLFCLRFWIRQVRPTALKIITTTEFAPIE